MWISRFIRRARERAGPERGFFMVWMALTLVTLTAFAGLGLEYGRWNNLAIRIQKAADAAALAGAVFMPENIGNKAFTTAKTTASFNGFTDGTAGVTITAAPGKLPNQLKVTIAVPSHNPWGQLVHYDSTTIVRSAVAEYQLPQNLGSPANSYGNDPESAAVQPQFWGNIFGPSSSKGKGDAIQSVGASANATLCDADNCASNINKDYDANGYFYGIDVPAGSAGALNVDIFDPAFVHVGDNCGGSDASDAGKPQRRGRAPGCDHSWVHAVRSHQQCATIRLRPASSAPATYYYGDDGNHLNPWTVWTLRAPDVSSWDPTNNPIVCQAEFPGVFPEATNDLPNGTIDAAHLSTLLQSAAPYPGTSPPRSFASFFRQWVSICSIANPTQGTYFLQVQTATKISGAATPIGGGSNRYAVRTGLGSNYTASNNLKLYGNQKMGIYANATGADTRFFLTRVLPGQAGHTLILNFFDVGDASQPGAIPCCLHPTPTSSAARSRRADTRKPPGNSTGPPWGTYIATSAGCQITNVSSASYNGQWITFEVPIPPDYNCDVADPLGCWTRLRFAYPAGTNVSDTTTWNAFMVGDPVRLIQ